MTNPGPLILMLVVGGVRGYRAGFERKEVNPNISLYKIRGETTENFECLKWFLSDKDVF